MDRLFLPRADFGYRKPMAIPKRNEAMVSGICTKLLPIKAGSSGRAPLEIGELIDFPSLCFIMVMFVHGSRGGLSRFLFTMVKVRFWAMLQLGVRP
jgi:hypothetical protein